MRGATSLIRLTAIAAMFGVGVASAATQAPLNFKAQGHEPSWSLVVGAEGLVLETPAGVVFKARHFERRDMHGVTRIEAAQKGRTIGVAMRHKACTDTMTGMPFPLSVSLAVAGRHLKGCGGDTLSMLEGNWHVVRMGGVALPPQSGASFDFARDGKLSGKAGCNRFFGGYKLTAEGLAFDALGTTKMACPQPAMQTEATFLKLAGEVTRVTTGEGHQLRLMSGDHEAFVLERAE